MSDEPCVCATQWTCLADEHRPYGLDIKDIDGVKLSTPAPVDWPARFRKAADVAEREGFPGAANILSAYARNMWQLPPHVVEAIGRELGGGM